MRTGPAAVRRGKGLGVSRAFVYNWISVSERRDDWLRKMNQNLDIRSLVRERLKTSRVTESVSDNEWIAEQLFWEMRRREQRGDRRSFGLRRRAARIRDIAESTPGRRHLSGVSFMTIKRRELVLEGLINRLMSEKGHLPIPEFRTEQQIKSQMRMSQLKEEELLVRSGKKKKSRRRIGGGESGGRISDLVVEAQSPEPVADDWAVIRPTPLADGEDPF